jgi:NADH-quinone oxidoreductase subunit N
MGMAGLSVLIGSFLAIVQTNIKRTMAYSSIAHAGFMLVGMYAAASPNAAGDSGRRAVLFYLLAYTFMSIGTFAVITVVGRQGDGDHSIEAYRGLAKREPILAAAFAVLLFGQVGAPFTAGFFAKFRVIAAAAQVDETGGYVLAGVAMLGAAVGAFLYLRVVVAMFLDDTPSVAAGLADAAGAATGADVHADALGDVAVSGDAVLVSERVLVNDQALDVPPLALGVAVLTAAVTVLLGIFPDLGAGVLAEAALSLIR